MKMLGIRTRNKKPTEWIRQQTGLKGIIKLRPTKMVLDRYTRTSNTTKMGRVTDWKFRMGLRNIEDDNYDV